MDNNEQQQQQIVTNANNLSEMQQQQQQQQILKDETNSRKSKPYVKILEQPASKALRFRYECEGRSAGSIPGVNSTSECKTYPTIEIVGYKGRAVVVVSCVTKDFPYRPHPHNLVGKDGCKKGVCTMEINSETMCAVFSNLGIQCVKKKDIEAALKAREDIRVDPFKTGFSHRFQPSSIDLNAVRLCFQVFTESEQKGRFTQPLPPVVTEPIYDKKAMSDLIICRLSSCTSSVLGNNQIILLCEKVVKDDIQVRFYEEKYGQVVWEAYGDFQQCDVHKQAAITFKTPRYQSLDITDSVKVLIQLKRPSDGMTSEPLPFEYVPLDSGKHQFWNIRRNLKRKPDLDIFQQILAINSDIDEVIDLNSPTVEAPLNDANNYRTMQETTTIDSNVILTNDIQKSSKEFNEVAVEMKNPLAAEIDSIIEEKVREMEQQQQEQADAQHEVVELIDPNILKPLTNQIEANDMVIMAEVPQFSPNDKINEWMKSNAFHNPDDSIQNASKHIVTDTEDKTLNELLDQVAELDEIYSDCAIKRDNYSSTLMNELNGMETCITADTNPTLVGGKQTLFDNESFDDAATYTSLQIAFKNPVNLPMDKLMSRETNLLLHEEQHNYNPIDISNARSPAPTTKLLTSQTIESGRMEEKIPPLPPKRLRKQDSDAENRSLEANIGDTTERKPPQSFPPIIIMKTPDQLPYNNKRLPPKPQANTCNTLPKQKKPGFFTKLFSRRKSKSDLNRSVEQIVPAAKVSPFKTTCSIKNQNYNLEHFDNINDLNRSSMPSIQSLQTNSVPVSPSTGLKTSTLQQQQVQQQHLLGKSIGRSVSSVSGKRPTHLNPNVIHIPLKGDSVHSLPQNEDYSHASTLTLSNIIDRKTASALQLADIPLCEGNMELVAIADRQSLRNLCEGEFNVHLDPNVDLTEAEHYALYTSIPPQATVSEFDDTSAYYAPIEDGEILTPEQVAERLIAANRIN